MRFRRCPATVVLDFQNRAEPGRLLHVLSLLSSEGRCDVPWVRTRPPSCWKVARLLGRRDSDSVFGALPGETADRANPVISAFRPEGRAIGLVGVGSAASTAVGTAETFLCRNAWDAVFAGPAGAAIPLFTLLGAYAVGTAIRTSVARVTSRIAYESWKRLRSDAFAHAQAMPNSALASRRPGETQTIVANDTTTVRTSLVETAQRLLSAALTAVAMVAGMVVMSPALTLVMAPAVAGVALGTAAIARRRKRVDGFLHQNVASGTRMVNERLSPRGAATSRHLKSGGMARIGFEANDALHATTASRTERSVLSLQAASGAGYALASAAAAYMAGEHLQFVGQVSPATLFTFITVSAALNFPLSEITNGAPEALKGIAAARRLSKFLQTPIDDHDVENAIELSRSLGRHGIEMRNVSLSYRQGKRALRNVDIAILPGETIGITGNSGSGKTTILNLIRREWDASEGEVRINGVDVRGVTRASLREMFTVVEQVPHFFYGSVMENLKEAKPDATYEEVEEACIAARIHEAVASKPDGYDALIDDGIGWSAGELQRLAIARAMLQDSPVVVLDEPTANLDSETIAEMRPGLDALCKGKTVLHVAHQLSTVINCDRIIVVDKGTIAEEGTHQSLMAGGGRYAALWAAQHPDCVSSVRPYSRFQTSDLAALADLAAVPIGDLGFSSPDPVGLSIGSLI